MRFVPQERVTISVKAVGSGRQVVRAGARGGFVATFPNVTTDKCVGTVVIARGVLGSRAALRVMPLACLPPDRVDR